MAIEFDCSGCGDLFRVADEMAGRKGKCPGCGVVNLIPSPEEARAITRAPRPETNQTRLALEEEESAVEVVETPSSEKKPRKTRLWPMLLGLGFLGLLLAGLGVGGYFLYVWYTATGMSEMKYLPNDTQLVVSVRVDQGLNSDLIRKVRNDFKPANSKDDPFDDSQAEKEYGTGWSNIERITLAGSLAGSGRENDVTIIRTRKSVRASDLKANMEQRHFEEYKLDRFLIYQNPSESQYSFCVAEDRIVVFGRFLTLKRLLDRGTKPELPEAMQKALDSTDFSRTVAIAYHFKELLKSDKISPNGRRPLQDLTGPLGQLLSKDKSDPTENEKRMEKLLGTVEAMNGSIEIKSDATVSVTLFCKDASAAEEIKKSLEEGLTVAKDQIKEIKEDADAPKASLAEAANNVTFVQNGNQVTARLVVTGDSVIPFVKKSLEHKAETRKKMEEAAEKAKLNKALPPPPNAPGAPPKKK